MKFIKVSKEIQQDKKQVLDPTEYGTVIYNFVIGRVDGIEIRYIILDSGAIVECITPEFAKKLGAVPQKLEKPQAVQLVNDIINYIDNYIYIETEVGGVRAGVIAVIYRDNSSYDFVLSQGWFFKIRIVQDWGKKEIKQRDR